MAEITPALVKTLRDRTNAPFGDCKKALVEADGDMDKAIEILRKKNSAIQAKASGREAEAVLWQAYDRIRARTLLLRGAESDLLSAQTAQAMAGRGPRARLSFGGRPGAPHAFSQCAASSPRHLLIKSIAFK